MILDNKYTMPYTVASSVIDGKYRCTPLHFAALSQDLAANHYSSTGLFIPHLQKIGLTWVITRQHFEIYEYPLWMDSLVLQTWAQPLKGLFCFRDFAYYYAEGGKKPSINAAFQDLYSAAHNPEAPADRLQRRNGLCVRGSSCWLVLDLNTNQPITPTDAALGTLTFCSEHLEGRVFPKIPLPESWGTERVFTASLLDIDMNDHVNNLNYIRWILSFMDAEFCRGKLLRVLDTNFLISAKYGEELSCRCAYTDGNVCIHSIIRNTDGCEVFRARTEWVDENTLSRPLQIDA
ncbi:MAG: thioesterase [Treponema sp.]